MRKTQIGVTFALLALVLIARPAVAGDPTARVQVNYEDIISNDPAFVFSAAIGGAYERPAKSGFARLSLRFGYHLASWFLLEVQNDVRLDGKPFWLAGFRSGFLYRRAKLSIEFVPAMLSVLWAPRAHDVGFVVSPVLEGNYRLASNHGLFLSLQVDILFRKLGFDANRQYFTTLLGWRVFF
ncbi:MAG: hypothetical protein KC609_21665 [Myxococcales bacterium]|nr:hypothetical protein [Myxococcales bacterium]